MNLEIAKKLQDLRKQNGYSQEELADKLQISRQAVSKWERAEASPDTDNIIALAKLYNVSLDELLLNEDLIKEDKEVEVINNNEAEVIDTLEEKEEIRSKGNIIFDIVTFSITLIIFIVLGIIYNIWHPLWLIFCIPLVLSSLWRVIERRDITKFDYVIFINMIYLFLGFLYGLWHPYWVLYITIAIWYGAIESYEKLIKKKEK